MVEVGTGGVGQKEIKTDWPMTEGLTAGTEKQEGREINLIAQEESVVLKTDSFGIE